MKITDSEFDAADLVADFVDLTKKGVYVDVGAGKPIEYSNSKKFRDAGWRVISIEPLPHFCDMFRALNYEIYQYAAYSCDLGKTSYEHHAYMDGLGGSCLDTSIFYPADYHKGLIDANYIKKFDVIALKLDTILENHCPEITHIDILDIDVEGYELDVLDGFTVAKYTPDVMIIENLNNYQSYYDCYKKMGYKIAAKAQWNQILIKE